ncbi:MAG: polyphosphate kinase [Actinobacteria bacterium RBG_16_68_21]|nr:MAG: polyphosphate kinase [Actinobacteria bacterium RBG_16_68_21]
MDRHRIAPGDIVALGKHDPAATPGAADEKAAKKRSKALCKRLEQLQELLYAQGKHRLLVVLQGMDTSGKDSVIRHVFEGVNPQGVSVASFKRPTPEELAHDYLWRVHRHVPGDGQITIFNRSHYEDVLAVRVHELVPENRWQRRYDQINAFERTLAEEGTTILKFFLHISRREQRVRLQSRLDDPTKQWKFSSGDLTERALWERHTAAYEAVLSFTSTEWAPWWLVPSDVTWYRNLVIGETIVTSLDGLDMAFPLPTEDLSKVTIE